MTALKASFPPLVYTDTNILILGSLPGEASLAAQEYYAYPQNRFWKTIAAVTRESAPSCYDEKKRMLQKHRIGLWDLAKTARREGSLDSNMTDETVNDIDRLLQSFPQIHTVAFNGKKAQVLFDKNFNRNSGIRYLALPSTSPANAGFSFEKLCEAWQKIIG
ncbi:MAG: DNA-deoxyinosine glycosylase [Prevotellaceae bacterium]|jgi:hypoxanthine-DNA glycosylase|nr:DNA-deoxyinosine glycosylase [Prevotellaceae bacterium]